MADTAQEAIRILKTEGPKAAHKFVTYFNWRRKGEICDGFFYYMECCYRVGNCNLLQNDLPFLIAKVRSILGELEDVKVIDLLANFIPRC